MAACATTILSSADAEADETTADDPAAAFSPGDPAVVRSAGTSGDEPSESLLRDDLSRATLAAYLPEDRLPDRPAAAEASGRLSGYFRPQASGAAFFSG